ncbi:unnamed protein product [Lathyrus sativus]|nr:unnamed protein product [Lathyrus sativus]
MLQEIVSIQRNFLLSGSKEKRDMAWVSKKSICKPKEEGEISIKDIVLFNRPLISKWLWRFIKEMDAIWVGSLEERYGNFVRRLMFKDVPSTKSQESLWWKDLMVAGDSMEASGFAHLISFRLGDETTTSFWFSIWICNSTLQNLYMSLCGILDRKDGVVKYIEVWVGDVWRWQLRFNNLEGVLYLWKGTMSWFNYCVMYVPKGKFLMS